MMRFRERENNLRGKPDKKDHKEVKEKYLLCFCHFLEKEETKISEVDQA